MTLSRTRRRTEECEPVGKCGDADGRETISGSSRSTLQAELESSARSHTREEGAVVPAYDPVSAGGTEPRHRLRELARSRGAAVGRAHRAPCARRLVEGDDSRRRAFPSTLVASLLRRGETAPPFRVLR